ncbi:conserved hypothetical protein [Citricoccus sp. K5]|nr:conserved hypothetical protein [Citricoccus sp. K5]
MLPSVDSMWNSAETPLGGVTVLNGTPAESTTLTGSVSGLVEVPAGVTVEVTGVLEDAVVSGAGTVRVNGLIAEVIHAGEGQILATVGSVLAPAEADGDWRVLSPFGKWSMSPEMVFPTAVHSAEVHAGPSAALGAGRAPTDLDWYPIPRD